MMSWQRHPHPTPPDQAPAFAPMTGRHALAWSLPLLLSRVLLFSQVLLLSLPLLGWADNLRVYDFDRDDQLVSADAYRPWAELMRRQAAEQPQLDACLADQATCPGHLRGFRSIVLAGRSLDRAGQLMLVERFIDRRRWRIESSADDEWRSLGTFLAHGGDCEDFAIAKYFVLRALGFTALEMRVVIARDITNGRQHALLAVRSGVATQLFDADDRVYSARAHGPYRFIYSINETALWDHTLQPGALQSADSARSTL